MIFKRYEWLMLLRVFILFITLLATCILILKGWYAYLVITVIFIAAELVDFLNIQKKAQHEITQFVQSVKYRDFSRHFDVEHAPNGLQPLRKGFNDINTTFKTISRERETQYQYLQKVLELVNTGIVSYELKTGEIGWLNESFKIMFGIPYLKTIHSLQKRDAILYDEATNMQPGDSKVISVTRDKQLIKVLLTISAMRSDDKMYRLIAFQNVSEALDESESKAWQRLLNVMTHEIMNSVAPISSLADTLKKRLQTYAYSNNQSSELDDLVLGVDTIKRRSEGLLKFTESYRSLNKITSLELIRLLARDLFENLNNLMAPTLDQKNIELDIVLRDPQMLIEVDINLIEQVLINLLVNAIEAVKDEVEPCITLSAEVRPNGKPVIKVADNGTGMPPELVDKIFIPFFSTRKTGSGIGLSLCKQIMMLHKGNMQVQSVEGEGSVFILSF